MVYSESSTNVTFVRVAMKLFCVRSLGGFTVLNAEVKLIFFLKRHLSLVFQSCSVSSKFWCINHNLL